MITSNTSEQLVLQCDSAAERDSWVEVVKRVAGASIYMQGGLNQYSGFRKVRVALPAM
jgi:predicted phosphoadenosine phosphosulfate sulfurtransferase